MTCTKVSILRVFLILVCILNLTIGGFAIYVDSNGEQFINISFGIYSIITGVFGIVAALKTNVWLIRIFAAGILILMILYAAAAAIVTQRWNSLLAMAEIQIENSGLDKRSPEFSHIRDFVVSLMISAYNFSVAMAIIYALSTFASLTLSYIVKSRGDNNAV